MSFGSSSVGARSAVALAPDNQHGSYWSDTQKVTFADLFCGIGGFHQAASQLGMECVFACEIDAHCRRAYEANYGIEPHPDVKTIHPERIPNFDILLAGFPCQPFSVIGAMQGFEDTRGTLFFDLARIIEAKRPRAFVLENVRQLTSHDKGRTLETIIRVLVDLGYQVEHRVLNALNFGLPQKRERVVIVGFREPVTGFEWPSSLPLTLKLNDILDPNPDPKTFASEKIRRARAASHTSSHYPSIWHENKSGCISSHPYSCALRANASHNYLLVNGERRLTPREMLRLQGFPDTFQMVCPDGQTRKQAGNAVPVPMIKAVLEAILKAEVGPTTRVEPIR